MADPLPDVLPPSRTLTVRAVDGTPLHAEVFGPPDGYPIVLSHGITCAIRAWAYQIADLSADYRVIAFDHRGHGRSGVPRRCGYSLNHLASDLDCVLEATVAPHERAVLAGHSMGGITIAAWSARYRHKVHRRVDAVALINTTTGDLVRQVKLFSVPGQLSPARVMAARSLINVFGGFPIPSAALLASRSFVAMLAVGKDADPSAARLIHELFARTSPAGRGGCARTLVESLGSRYLDLSGLTVPTLVIGSEQDRLTPIGASREIARTAPNVVGLVELPGGHCSMLEHHREVTGQLRLLAESVALPVAQISS
ncbi:non-heme haloperoxidase Hpx [Mycobacterium montefiorense]|uniref:Non-heme haloperoxidase Hpx n=1 Tax=Mycobacterium montefiorense TaxID=154654 RepID=A0AA37V0W0_9MYCO|nr:non-heme haloperoxidase Hpx [Mycobacterium montefiorense]GKU37026.1 non-heme haloperoxidase Hpx [Mycobacterium montefiorense]GKU43069.1 non-heme haloperoxidase Hpx [Mycobacterium montefiorense]GKU48620.1 non-heme haloperoxidase Hpx [Mycobacterium montefiorense]GKU50650.1 non-heme haloperoxidase Hpx [Mycobacterium montefiorense]